MARATKPYVYVETTVIGYLAMRVSGVLRVAANQQTTRDWWDNHREDFELVVSRFVVDECSDGDPTAARERLAYLEGIPLLGISDEIDSLAVALIAGVPLPEKAAIDALHISVFRGSWCRIPVDVELQADREPIATPKNRTYLP